jgi:hypothetical protein
MAGTIADRLVTHGTQGFAHPGHSRRMSGVFIRGLEEGKRMEKYNHIKIDLFHRGGAVTL